MVQIPRSDYARALRPDGRRPDPARRHRSVDRGRAGPDRGRRGGRLRRRQVDPGVDGAGQHHAGRGRPGHRHHQRDRARPLGHRAGRRRHPRRPDRRARPGRQPRHRRRRAPRAADRAVHRRHLRRGQDPHRRRHRHPRAPDLAVAGRRGAGHRPDHAGRRRHRSERGLQGDHGHARGRGTWRRSTAPSTRSRSTCCCWARATRSRRGGCAEQALGRRRRLQAARGLGLHAGRDRRGAPRPPTSGGCRSPCTPTR